MADTNLKDEWLTGSPELVIEVASASTKSCTAKAKDTWNTTRFDPSQSSTSPEMHVRLAGSKDLDAVMTLVRGVVPVMRASGNLQWDDEYPTAATFLHDVELAQLWIAEAAGQIAGVAAITTDQAPEYADVGWDTDELAVVVHRLAVNPAFRRQGVAEILMRQAEIVARTRGIAVMRIDTNIQNDAAQRLFSKLGYAPAGEIGLGFRPGLRVRCFEKRLS